MAKVYVSEYNQVLEIKKKQNLLDLLLESDIPIENPCNGKGTCYKCKVKIKTAHEIPINAVEKEVLSQEELAAGIRLACLYSIDQEHNLEVELLVKEKKHQVLSTGKIPFFVKELQSSGYGLAIDIGTTTIAAILVDLKTGEQLRSATRINSQKKYGLDVLTRITFEYENSEAIIKLQETIISDLNEMIVELSKKNNIEQTEIIEVTIAANCTMLHMLLGVDAKSIGKAPYQPCFTDAQNIEAQTIGLKINDSALVYCLPSVSSYIGADIVAGTYVSKLHLKKNNTLFIDIGTNGEIVLSSQGQLTCCSCAAGPALEGMNISSGMRAAEGAIQGIEIKKDQIIIDTIGDTIAQGLCGSGILATIKELLQTGILKKSGAFIKKDALDLADYRQKYLRLNGTKREFIIQEKTAKQPEIMVSINDVRQVQLAKGAILSGFMALLDKSKLTMNDLDEIIIAGQFGAHLSPDILAGTGIIPFEVANKVSYIGNSSCTGAYMCLMSKKVRSEIEQIAKKMEYFELAETDDYEKIFSKCLIFPSLTND